MRITSEKSEKRDGASTHKKSPRIVAVGDGYKINIVFRLPEKEEEDARVTCSLFLKKPFGIFFTTFL
jgi:hypothetical protein